MIDRARIGTLLAPGLKSEMIGAYTDVPDTLSGLFNKSKSSKAFEEWTGMTTVGIAEEKPEGTGVVYKDPTVLPVKRLVHVTYGLGIRATREAIDDEQYGQLKKLARLVGRSFAIRKQVEMATLFNDASTGTYFTGYDAKPLIDAGHPLTGLTWAPGATTTIGTRATATAANELATAADLDYVSLQDMITLMRRQVDEQGDWVSFTPSRLVIAPENEFVAYEILKSTLRPDTANQGISSVSRFNLTVVTSPYFVDTDAWFLMADNSNHDLQFFTRQALKIESTDDFDTGDMKTKGTERFSLGFSDWRGICGTMGA